MVSVLHDSDLSPMLESLKAMDDPAARGPAFEQYVRRLFGREHFKVTMNPGGAKPRQVDLMASRHDLTYLVETKWEKKPSDIDDVDSLFTRLAEVQASVIGVFVSWPGFTKTVVQRVEDKRARPVLLVTGEELERTDSLVRLLRHKHEHLVTHGRVVFGAESLTGRTDNSDLPVGSDRFVDRAGQRLPWISSGGDYGRIVFVGELPDIDWVIASGTGVVVDLDVPLRDEGGVVSVLSELTDLGWTTSQGRWSIQQATVNWHGSGAAGLAEALGAWKKRYKGLDVVHHTEEFSYVDVCAEGFYSLCGDVSADKRRMERRLSMSMQLIGTPVRPDSVRHLCDVLGVDDPIFYRPRTDPSVVRTRPPERVALDVVGFITEDTRWPDDDDGEWATGVVVKNPYRHQRGAQRPEWWPEMLDDTELVVCALRSWHPLSRAKKSYYLWNCEAAWTSDALVVRPLADWDDNRKPAEQAPRSARRTKSRGARANKVAKGSRQRTPEP